MTDLYKKLFGDIMRIEDVNFTLVDKSATAPTRAHQFDAGNDLYALESKEIKPGELVKIRTGVAVSLPEGTQGIVKDRSSMGSKSLHVFAGVIDCGYTGEISVMLYNANSWLTPESIVSIVKQSVGFDSIFGWFKSKDTIFANLTSSLKTEYESKVYKINKGDKIAQLIVSPITVVNWWRKTSLESTERGSKGFGSSGK